MRVVVLGAGITGVAFSAMASKNPQCQCLLLEKGSEVGGWCKSIHQDGFVWDYSGHFFHFRDPLIQRFFYDRIGRGNIVHVDKKMSRISFNGRMIDFPFQKNIHQLAFEDFIDCLVGLADPPAKTPTSFKDFVISRFGEGIANRFLIPYNEKLYGCPLNMLDASAMGRFFPNPSLIEIIKNFKQPDNSSYNDSFIYPKRGAIDFVKAFDRDLESVEKRFNIHIHRIHLDSKVIETDSGDFQYDFLVSTAPLPWLVEVCGLSSSVGMLTSNKVAVFNLGFDRPALLRDHWIYFPDPQVPFYRVGFYSNIVGDGNDRMSIYVEVGSPGSEPCTVSLEAVIAGLRTVGIITTHNLVSWSHVEMDPAYCHLSSESISYSSSVREQLSLAQIFSMGRYGQWTYCSIEDNLLEAEATSLRLGLIQSRFFEDGPGT